MQHANIATDIYKCKLLSHSSTCLNIIHWGPSTQPNISRPTLAWFTTITRRFPSCRANRIAPHGHPISTAAIASETANRGRAVAPGTKGTDLQLELGAIERFHDLSLVLTLRAQVGLVIVSHLRWPVRRRDVCWIAN